MFFCNGEHEDYHQVSDEVETLVRAAADQAHRVAISAQTGAGLDILRAKILSHCQEHEITLDLKIPQAEGRLLSQLHKQGEILEQSYDADDAHLRVRLGRAWAERWGLERFELN